MILATPTVSEFVLVSLVSCFTLKKEPDASVLPQHFPVSSTKFVTIVEKYILESKGIALLRAEL